MKTTLHTRLSNVQTFLSFLRIFKFGWHVKLCVTVKYCSALIFFHYINLMFDTIAAAVVVAVVVAVFLTSGVNFTSILKAAFAQIFFPQKV
jgi:hypothetical protein